MLEESSAEEERPAEPRFKFIPFAIISSIIGICLLVGMSLRANSSFPTLPTGVHVGQITGVFDDEPTTLYVEKLRNSNAALVVIFREGWTPTVVRLQTDSDGTVLPLEIEHEAVRYRLSGHERGGAFSGEIRASNKSFGAWSLTPMPASVLRSARIHHPEKLLPWLESTAQHASLAEQKSELGKQLEIKQKTRETLRQYVASPDPLQERAMLRITDLDTKLATIEQQRDALRTTVKDTVRELDQLTRITKRGRAIDLVRRLAKREAKWYEVNWQQEADIPQMEEALAEQMGIDLRKLRERVGRAEELRTLRADLAREQEAVRVLSEQYRQKTLPQQVPSPTPPPKEEKAWWKLDNIF